MKIDMRQSPGSFLRKAVLANAIFSALSGLLIVLFEPTVLRWLGVDPIGIWPIGAMLLGFSLYLLWLAYGRNVPVSLVKGVILAIGPGWLGRRYWFWPRRPLFRDSESS